MAYATTEELNEFMGLEGQVPDRTKVGEDRSLEVVGTGDNSKTRFYTDRAAIIADSYTFYYGTTESTALTQPLTETTHYELDKDDGILDLTGTGVTLVGTASIYGSYQFNLVGIPDSRLSTAISQAESYINKECNTSFTDGTQATPSYTQVTNEKHTGQGRFQRDYFLENYPLPDVSCITTELVGTGSASIAVDSTNGFLSSGVLGDGTNKITYTGKSGSAFTGVSNITSTINSGSTLTPYIFEISTTDSGTEPSWTVLNKDSDYDLDLVTGKVHIYRDDIELSILQSQNPPNLIPNRFRATYLAGSSTVPTNIKKATLMLASQDLLHMAVRKAHTSGMNNFEPGMIDVDKDWVEKILDRYRSVQIKNT